MKSNTHHTAIQLLPDLSRHTLQQCRNLATITKALRNHKILHKWSYPAKLYVTHNGVSTLISTLEEGIAALCQWGVLPEPTVHKTPHPQPSPLQEDWQVVSRKRSSKKNTDGTRAHNALSALISLRIQGFNVTTLVLSLHLACSSYACTWISLKILFLKFYLYLLLYLCLIFIVLYAPCIPYIILKTPYNTLCLRRRLSPWLH